MEPFPQPLQQAFQSLWRLWSLCVENTGCLLETHSGSPVVHGRSCGNQQVPVCLPPTPVVLMNCCGYRFPLSLCFLSRPEEGYSPAVQEPQPHWAGLCVCIKAVVVYLLHLPACVGCHVNPPQTCSGLGLTHWGPETSRSGRAWISG